ncbi:c-type cytochrome domain-containing protein, partial [Limnobacter sp.]|uniref:c-type cytochrome domain-containing protein n=1 Tax=Limnobacter sp. TaxID=2003368 RepID=UPI00311E07FE
MNKSTLLFGTAAGIALIASNASAAEKIDFKKDIAPILEKRCIECHGAEKKKGGLRLHTKDDAIQDGVVTPGKPDESEFYTRVILAKDHDDIMPPKGDPLTKAEQDKFKAWIAGGAVWPSGFVVGGTAAAKKDEGPGPAPTAAEKKAVAELEKAGVTVRQIAQKLNWTYVNLRVIGEKFDAKVFQNLAQVATLQELNAAGVKLTDADLANIGKLKNLKRLHLEHTTANDKNLASLKGLSNLEYLNHFDTAVTDAGLQHLEGLGKLKSLYLFQTKTTDKGVTALRGKLAKAYVDTGWDLKELEKIKAEIKAREDARKKKEEEEKKAAEAKKKADAEAKKKADAAKKADATAKKPTDDA